MTDETKPLPTEIDDADAMFEACSTGDTETVEKLLRTGFDKDRDLMRGHTRSGNTPLNVASWNGCIKVVDILLRRGADMEKSNSQGATPLHSACAMGHSEIAASLIHAGACKDARDEWERTPLFVAVFCRRDDAAEILIRVGADASIPDKFGRIPLDVAKAENCQKIVAMLSH